MQYEARITAANGAFHTFEFEADMACLAVDHLIHVSNDPSMLRTYPAGIARWDRDPRTLVSQTKLIIVLRMEYRRRYKSGNYSNWRVA